MKLTHAFLLLCTALVVSCKKDDPAPANDPPLTSAEEVTFTNGSYYYVLAGWGSWTPWFSELTGRRISGDGASGNVNLFIDFNGDVQEGETYQLGTTEAIVSFSDHALLKMWYSTAGSVTITMKDETLHILRGTFDATVYNDGTEISPQGYPTSGIPSTYHLTNGIFDVKYSE